MPGKPSGKAQGRTWSIRSVSVELVTERDANNDWAVKFDRNVEQSRACEEVE